MKRWEILLAIVGALILTLGAYWIRRGELPRRDTWVLEPGCRTPVTIFDPPADIDPAGSAIVLHGLAASRRIMMYFGEDFAGHGIRTYLLDLAGHGDNPGSYSFANAENCARTTIAALMRTEKLDPTRTVLVGHSMGGEISIRMADKIPLAATIAISPAPMVVPRRMPANLLVFSAQFDVWQLRDQAVALQQAAGGDRDAPEDFAQARAFDLVYVPMATHTSMLDDRRVTHRAELWAMQTLLPHADSKTLALNLDLGTYETFSKGRTRLAGAIIGTIGIFMLPPLCIEIAAMGVGRAREGAFALTAPSHWLVMVEVAVASLAAVLLFAKWIPMSFLRIYAADYLASLVLIVSIVLLVLNRDVARKALSTTPRAILAAAALGICVMLALGAWFDWQLADFWLNAPRWLRFAELLPIAFVFCYAEEIVLGPVAAGRARAFRFGCFLSLRLEIWLVCVFAFFVLASGQILLPILFLQLAGFSVAQRLAADALLRQTGSVTAAALFGAILAAWFVAAVFPIT
jgi:pimeloyl-ACP methyl ester carboxylesterase